MLDTQCPKEGSKPSLKEDIAYSVKTHTKIGESQPLTFQYNICLKNREF